MVSGLLGTFELMMTVSLPPSPGVGLDIAAVQCWLGPVVVGGAAVVVGAARVVVGAAVVVVTRTVVVGALVVVLAEVVLVEIWALTPVLDEEVTVAEA